MLRPIVIASCLLLLLLLGTIRCDERVLSDKYVRSMNRFIEITHKLMNVNTTSVSRRFDPATAAWNAEEFPEENPALYQGDISLTEGQLDALVEDFEIQLAAKEGRSVPERLFSVGVGLWEEFPISWSIDDKRPPHGGADAIRKGIALLEEATCVTFKEGGNQTNGHIRFFSGTGCNSPYGKQDMNNVSIGLGCQKPAIIAHEVGHSLGMFHTQMRPDVERYVEIFWSHIQAGKEHNFKPPEAEYQATTREIPYDYGSLMHYGRRTFSIRAGLPTMLPYDQNYNQTMGQRSAIAFTDAKEINAMYCGQICVSKLPCAHGGYTDPKDCSKCRCPDGLGGKLCDTVAASPAHCGGGDLKATENFQTLSKKGASRCVFRITAPAGKKITVIVDEAAFDGGNNQQACSGSFVELKYSSDLQIAGARFCPRTAIGSREVNSVNPVFVVFQSERSEYGFSLRYKFRDV